MSNFIPIVSSSPPPLEDTGGFDDWGDDDDFGGFIAADQTQNEWNNSQTYNKTEDQVNANLTSQIPQNFTDTEKIENCKSRSSPMSLNLDKSLPYSSNNISSEEILDNKSLKDSYDNKKLTESKTLDNLSGNSTGDSGLFDVSPVPISEDTKSENSDESPDQDTFQETSDDIPTTKDTPIINTDSKTEADKNEMNNERVNGNQSVENIDGHELSSPQCSFSTKEDSQNIKMSEHDKSCDHNTDKENTGNINFNSNLTTNEFISKNVDTNTSCITDDDALSNSCSSLNTNNSVSSNDTNSSPEEKKLNIETSNCHDQNMEFHSDQDTCARENTDSDDMNENLEQSSEEPPCDTTNKDDVSDSVVLSGGTDSSSEIIVYKTGEESSDFAVSNIDLATDKLEKDLNKSEEELSFTNESPDDHEEFADSASAEVQEEHSYDSITQKENSRFEDINENMADDLKLNSDPSKVEDSKTDDEKIKQENDEEFVKHCSEVGENDEEFAKFTSEPKEENEEEFVNFSSSMTDKKDEEFENYSSAKSNDNENEFANFSSAKTNGHEDEDEFADFSAAKVVDSIAEFTNYSSTNLNENQDEIAKCNSSNTERENDAFAKFSSASAKEQKDEDFGNFASDGNLESEDEFADFSSAQNDAEFTNVSSSGSQFNIQDGANDSDSWATFQQTDTTIPSIKPAVSVVNTQISVVKDGSTLSECFHESVVLSEQTTDLDAVIQENKNQLWIKLQKVDRTAILKWSQFSSNKNLFVSLKIDTKNILLGHKKPTVPIYAANLTLLEPTKGLPALQPEVTLVDTDKTEDVKDLPPVQFDWTTSGLTNPLEVNSKLQQLDFLTVDDPDLQVKLKAFDSELIHGQRTAMQPLQNILANLKVTKKTRLEDLSNEAGRVISHLPDLSFMKAKVLMFPLKQNNL